MLLSDALYLNTKDFLLLRLSHHHNNIDCLFVYTQALVVEIFKR